MEEDPPTPILALFLYDLYVVEYWPEYSKAEIVVLTQTHWILEVLR
jgi:hypothetical protein